MFDPCIIEIDKILAKIRPKVFDLCASVYGINNSQGIN